MVLFDIVVGFILLFALIKGSINGFIKELASFVALVAGLLVAIFISNPLSEWLDSIWHFKYWGIVSFLMVFIGIVIGVHLLAKSLDKMVEGNPLSVFNRIAGGLFAGLKYLFLVSIFISIMGFFDKESLLIEPQEREKSYLYEYVSPVAPSIFSFLNFDILWQEKVKEKKSEKEILI